MKRNVYTTKSKKSSCTQDFWFGFLFVPTQVEENFYCLQVFLDVFPMGPTERAFYLIFLEFCDFIT